MSMTWPDAAVGCLLLQHPAAVHSLCCTCHLGIIIVRQSVQSCLQLYEQGGLQWVEQGGVGSGGLQLGPVQWVEQKCMLFHWLKVADLQLVEQRFTFHWLEVGRLQWVSRGVLCLEDSG